MNDFSSKWNTLQLCSALLLGVKLIAFGDLAIKTGEIIQ